MRLSGPKKVQEQPEVSPATKGEGMDASLPQVDEKRLAASLPPPAPSIAQDVLVHPSATGRVTGVKDYGARAFQPERDTGTKVHRVVDWEVWYDKGTRLWWATQHGGNGEQIGDALNAYSKIELGFQMQCAAYPEAYKQDFRPRVEFK